MQKLGRWPGVNVLLDSKTHDGNLDEFERLAAKCAELVRTKDTGTLQYETRMRSNLLR